MDMAIELEALESQIARREPTAVLQGETYVLDLKHQIPDDEGRLMLHHAAEHSSSETVLQAVYEANPAAAAVLDKSSRLPLVIGLESRFLQDWQYLGKHKYPVCRSVSSEERADPSSSKPVTFYVLSVGDGLAEIAKRFSEFDALRAALVSSG